MTTVAIAGYGSAGRGIHGPLFEPAGLTVIGVSTSNPTRAEQVKADFPEAEVVRDLNALLDLKADVLVLATPSGDHLDHATLCLDAGQPVVVDKPLAVDPAGAALLVERSKTTKTPLTVFQNRRFDPQHTTLRRLLKDGQLGEVFRHEFRWERWRPEPKDRWRENASAADGGGLLLDLHSHLVDASIDLFGPVERVFAQVAARSTRAEDDAFVVCEHAGGVTSHLSATSLAGAPGPRLRVLGRAGTYLLDDFEEEPSVYPDLRHQDGQSGWLVRGDVREPVQAEPADQADFYRAVAAALGSADPQGAMPVDPADAVHVLEVIDAARRSAAEHQVISL
ncbi:Gfo/Idh/MocA family protein [Demetria terragena]|uniref:Gfo/Idh/MocA family protein n=1 Tax=Demetria terragena TaxID=63959 RepID=UPI00035C5E44|nr:Gfo/Idh/MocA family oxidoreductase [Demetria terragena]